MKKTLIELHDVVLLSECKRWLNRHYQEKDSIFLVKNTKEAINIMHTHPIDFFLIELSEDQSKSDGLESLAALAFYHPLLKTGILIPNTTPQTITERLDKLSSFCNVNRPETLKDFIELVSDLDIAISQTKSLSEMLVADFLELISIRNKTCLLVVETDNKTKKGIVYFERGVLYDAAYADNRAESAILEILRWKNVNINFRNLNNVDLKKFRKQIQQSLTELIANAVNQELDEQPIELLPISDEAEVIETTTSQIQQSMNLQTTVELENKTDAEIIVEQEEIKTLSSCINKLELMDILKPLQDIDDDYLASAIFDLSGNILIKHQVANHDIECLAKNTSLLIKNAFNIANNIALGQCQFMQLTCNEAIFEVIWEQQDYFAVATLLKATTKNTGLAKMYLAKICDSIHNELTTF